MSRLDNAFGTIIAGSLGFFIGHQLVKTVFRDPKPLPMPVYTGILGMMVMNRDRQYMKRRESYQRIGQRK